MKKIFASCVHLFIIIGFVIQPINNVRIAQAQEGAIASALIQCTGLAEKIAGAINALFGGLFEVPVTQSKETCLDAIGYALARTLLAKFTDATINWINGGFEGKPLYVENFGDFILDELKDQAELGLQELKRSGNMFFDVVKQAKILEFRQELFGSSSIIADIVMGVCTYGQPETEEFCSQQLTPESQRELFDAYLDGQIAGRKVGWDWDFWLSMTQNCGNNPFCSVTDSLNKITTIQQQAIQQTNNTLNRSSGFLGTQKCTDDSYEEDLQVWRDEVAQYSSSEDPTNSELDDLGGSLGDSEGIPTKPQCKKWKTTTPGSIVADKIKLNLGTTERQLELADELNESIAAIFDALFNKLLEQGLSSFRGGRGDGDDDDPYYAIFNSGEELGFGMEPTIGTITRDERACEVLGGIYDPELEICEFVDGGTGQTGYPSFPWVLDVNGTPIQIRNETEFSVFLNQNRGRCVEVNNLVIVEGAEPCIRGTSAAGGGGQNITLPPPQAQGTATLTPPTANAGGRATVTIRGARGNLQFDILINGTRVAFGSTSSTGDAIEELTLPQDYSDSTENVVLFSNDTFIPIVKSSS